jgi:hypothetical protein
MVPDGNGSSAGQARSRQDPHPEAGRGLTIGQQPQQVITGHGEPLHPLLTCVAPFQVRQRPAALTPGKRAKRQLGNHAGQLTAAHLIHVTMNYAPGTRKDWPPGATRSSGRRRAPVAGVAVARSRTRCWYRIPHRNAAPATGAVSRSSGSGNGSATGLRSRRCDRWLNRRQRPPRHSPCQPATYVAMTTSALLLTWGNVR